MASDAAASDDSDMRSIAHIGTIASAVGLAMGERLAAPGRDILAAMVLGYEIAGRVDEALTPGRMQRGFHGSVATIFGGAVTAGRLLQLDAERMTQAIVLAATSAGGLAIAADTSCAREYHAGLAALLGTQAALAAHAGFEGEPVLLDAPRGFFAAFNGQAVDEVARGLGDDWDIVTDMAIKLMPGAHPFHAIAEAAITAAIDGDVRPEAVRRIVIRAPQLDTWRKQAVQPHDLVGAAHSVAVLRGRRGGRPALRLGALHAGEDARPGDRVAAAAGRVRTRPAAAARSFPAPPRRHGLHRTHRRQHGPGDLHRAARQRRARHRLGRRRCQVPPPRTDSGTVCGDRRAEPRAAARLRGRAVAGAVDRAAAKERSQRADELAAPPGSQRALAG